MADECKPFDLNKKAHIDDTLIPQLDDAVIRIARMRKNQVLKCKCEARDIIANSVKYYSHVTVESEPIGENSTLQGLIKYEPIEVSCAKNLPTFSKELTSCLTERHDLQKAQKREATVSEDDEHFQPSRFSRIKSAQTVPMIL